MTVATLASLRELVEKTIPQQQKTPWRHVAEELKAAVKSGNTADLSIALRLPLSLNRVGYQMK
jgi:hypothetical protein